MDSCIVIPMIENLNGEEVESKLFNDLRSTFSSRDTVVNLYGLAKSKIFLDKAGDNIKFDENGEATFDSLQKFIDFNEFSSPADNTKLLQRANNKEYSDIIEIIEDANKFNETNKDHVAIIIKDNLNYKINIEPKTSKTVTINDELIANSHINDAIIKILGNIGLKVNVNANYSNVHGMFNPLFGKENARKLGVIIEVANNEAGMNSLPEEFSHFIIEGLNNEPLVQRILNFIRVPGVVGEILGDEYDYYKKLYKGDAVKERMEKEAAGKLLAKYFYGEETKIVPKFLFQRLFDRFKTLFKRINKTKVAIAINEASKDIESLAKGIKNGSLISLIDIDRVFKAEPLAQVSKKINIFKNLALKVYENRLKSHAILQRSLAKESDLKESIIAIDELQKSIAKGKYMKGVIDFLGDASDQLEDFIKIIDDIYSQELLDVDKTESQRAYVARRIISMKNFINAYEDIVKETMTIRRAKKADELTISDEDEQTITNLASSILTQMKLLESDFLKIETALTYNTFRPFFGKDGILEVTSGKHKGEVITLDAIISSADKDLNWISRYLQSAANSGDIFTGLMDSVIKIHKKKAMQEALDFHHDAKAILNAYTISSGSTDTSFIYEVDENNIPTGYLVSNVDHAKYKKDLKIYLDSLKDKNLSDDRISELESNWISKHTVQIPIKSGNNVRFDTIPNPKLFPSDKLTELNKDPAKKAYLERYKQLKNILDNRLPDNQVNVYKAIQIRDSGWETIKNSQKAGSSISDILTTKVGDQFEMRENEVEFGERHGLTDFKGKMLRRVPIYYTQFLKDPSRLSLDSTASLIAYSSMATNYYEMSKIVDLLEIARDVSLNRKVSRRVAGKKVTQVIDVLGKIIKSESVLAPGESNNITDAIDDLMMSQLYGQEKNEEARINIGTISVSTAKIGDTLMAATSILTMGLSPFIGINNVLMGKFQLFLEGIAGEYFSLKDLKDAEIKYFKLLGKDLTESGSNVKMSVLELLRKKFDIKQDNLKDSNFEQFYKTGLFKASGMLTPYFMMTAGEHYLSTKTLLAYLHSKKLLLNGVSIKAIDAFEVTKIMDGDKVIDGRLDIKKGVTNIDGTPFTINDINRIALIVGKINQAQNGIYNAADKNALHRYVLGRMVMMFRNWMVPHYNRRFRGVIYDAQLEKFTEGFYATTFRYAISNINIFKKDAAIKWSTLSTHEKANVKRAVAEIGTFVLLSIAIGSMGSWKDKKGSWSARMLDYQMRRLHLELGISLNPLTMFKEGMTILQSPSAVLKSLTAIADALTVSDLFKDVNQENKYFRNLEKNIPLWKNIKDTYNLSNDDARFAIFR